MTEHVEPARHAPYLPRYSDPKDIEDFVTKLESFERSELTAEQFRAFRLQRGVYGQRQDGVQMLRVKIPYGLVGPEQLEALADVADNWGHGIGNVTTRQNVQFHFVQMKDIEPAMRRLDEAGLTTREACGNTARTVTGCEVAEVCKAAPFDISPYAESLTRYFLRHPLSGGLPRKFKTAFSGCASDCAMTQINDLGFIATVKNGEPGFIVVAAGGLSTSPQAAITLHEFVHPGEIARIGEAILRLFNRLGNRDNKHRARLKYVLRKLGEAKFRETYAQIRAEVDAEAAAELKLPEAPSRTPAPPVEAPEERPAGFLAWRASAVVDQKQDGYAAVYIRLQHGELSSKDLRGLARIVGRFGDGSVRLTIDQNALLSWVHQKSLPALYAALTELGLTRTGVHTARDVVACPGAESCNLAVTSSRALGAAITARLEEDDARELAASVDTSIKISGCPNSCGQHHVADLGFHGGAKSFGNVTVPVYQLHLGGGVDENGARFGRQVVKIIARRVPEAVVLLMKLYETDRKEGERPRQFFQRVDPKRVTAALASLAGPPAAGEHEEADIGEERGFVVDLKEGECAA
ncbi:nitrite/sulfite reductase [Pendulispora albinea]|uniref:Nitrite/sulfite reductase n=1 Tax=Pendulispora albinea TaxID=2741071 RepID=A0ABZ2LUR9_9BACT